MSNESSSSGGGCGCISSVATFIGLASVGAGAYHGYMDAQGMPLPKENLEVLVKYGPTIIQGTIGASILGFIGLGGGTVAGVTFTEYYEHFAKKIATGVGGAVLGTAVGVTVGGAIGGAIGAFETLAGYGIGYFAGAISR